MKLTIHRGSKEIGGTCIELQSNESRILMDFGLPLVNQDNSAFDSRTINSQTKTDLIKQGLLPDIKGFYKDEPTQFDAILLSHPHQDHYGLLSFVNPDIPVMSEGCKALIDVSYLFGQTDCDLKNIDTRKAWKPFRKGNFNITPYLVDHSGFDAFAYLIEGESKRIFYSGDFRGHGRKSILFDNILKNPPKNIDYLLMEGSMIGRDNGKYETEKDIENELTNFFDKDELMFISCSSQNIDRIVSVVRACIKSNRIFVIDPYTALVLDKLKGVSVKIPQFDWEENIRIFFIPNSYTERMAKNKSLYKFKTAKITFEEIQEKRNKLVIKDSFTMRNIFAKKGMMDNSRLIYSMWNGYLPELKPFWDKHNVPIDEVHASGHAYVEELKAFVKALKPRKLIPIHTFYPEKYPEYFGDTVMMVKDGETVEL